MMPDLGGLIMPLLIICAVAVPLGVWKLIDLIIWVANHVSIH